MSWFRRKTDEEPEMSGWRIITRRNDALDKTVYRVFLPGFFTTYASRRPTWKDFDNYDDALAYYHDQTGWRNEEEAQP